MNIMRFVNVKVNELYGIRNMIKLTVFMIISFVKRKLKKKHQVNEVMSLSIHRSIAR